ncbi:tensin-1-like isoform X2 [Mercenaria mercenaria]|uniref:tensin-1-like isoform X2 n=1 Tax=Mercenaria mercenaria TaxID=6596 RepID=UPI00234F4E73|nr:tensin-1-like isoform X2 [Mercenaria mercenaria]
MYLGRAKKAIDQLDQKEFQEKEAKHAERESSKSESIEMRDEFAPEELPDGACFRLKSVNVGTEDGATATRQAEYIGSFSVSGEDQTARTEFVQRQLESMHAVEKSKKVLLVMSLTGVKVCSSNGESVYMAHALKRISYAACDPEHRQFAFLAREPKGHINIQFCHAFITKTPEEAEELNTIIGNAFKMAYAQQKTRQPTFNELIEKQLVEQKAKFAEYQEQANRALQQRLNEIATPTALQRMELRRQSSSDDLLESNCSTPPASEKDATKNKIWAKHAIEKVTHRSQALDGPARSNSPTFSSSRPSSSSQQQVTGKSDPNFSATKRNSTPVQLSPSKSSNFNSNVNSPKRNSSPYLSTLHNFQVVTIRESLENNVNNSNRFKGSPVTALKDEIDRRFLSNGGGGTLDSGLGWGIGDDMDSLQRLKLDHHYDNEDQLQAPPTPSKMQNRPLPAIPASTDFNDHRASPKLRNWTSLDDDVIPNHTRSTMQSRLRDSPKRRPQRPQSEVILDSKLSVFSGGSIDQPGVYIYGFKSQTQNELSKNCNVHNSNQLSSVNISPQFSNRSMQNQHSRDANTQQRYSPKVNNSNHQYSPKGNNFTQTGYDNMNSLPNGKASPPIHYQNGSPSHNAVDSVNETSSSTKKEKGSGLESLMGLDRSHIEDETLRHSCWYQAGIPRDVALEILQQEDIGSFIVRDSSTHPGCYALSVRVPKFENPTGISHYLILKTARGVKLKGLDKEWSSLLSLVTHHTVMPEMLPCTLRLPRDTNNPAFKATDKDEKEEDPDYQRLADFSSMMEALKQ